MDDGWAIHYGRGLRCFTFDEGRAPVLAAALHGTIHPMVYREATVNLREQLERFEGRRHEAYPDPLTGGEPFTIGIGHTGPEVHPGLVWSDAEVDAAFDMDVAKATAECRLHFPWFDTLTEPRQAVLIGMAFQLGINGVLRFVNTMADVRDGNYAEAAQGMRSSKWATQTPSRVLALAHQMETGNWA